MAVSYRERSGQCRRLTQACALMLVLIGTLLASAAAGWSPPLPSVWTLLAVAAATRLAGAPGGTVAAAMAVALALHAEGFTTSHAPDVSVWGAPRQRVVAFALAAAIVVVLVHRWAASGARLVSAADVWERSGGDESWLIAELDVDGWVRSVNAAGARLLGHAPDDIRGRSFMSMTHTSDREQLGFALARLRRGRRTEPVSVRLLTASGHERSFVGRAFRVSEAGHVVITAAIPELPMRPSQNNEIAKTSPLRQSSVASH
jgi:PAS domain S-box-containing protein